MREQIGTPSYMAPELWADHEVEYDSSVDLWAMGVVTYMLL
jgi:serine/threonine protein kinase